MSLKVIGAGLGRTGTHSLKLALNQLGLGPCHHMEAVIQAMPQQVPLWVAAIKGRPDWAAIFQGFNSAVDWPTASFYAALATEYPAAKFVLTHRDPQSWADSFGETIYKLLQERHKMTMPPPVQEWLDMAQGVIALTGIGEGLGRDQLIALFLAHNAAVKAAIPPDRLLVWQVKEGWGPLCTFLGVAAPADPFPRSNDRAEFWDLVKGKPH